MTDETVLETEIPTDPSSEPVTEPVETEAAETDDGSVTETTAPETIPETSESETVPETTAVETAQETTVPETTVEIVYWEDTEIMTQPAMTPEEPVAVTTEPVYIEVIESVGSDIIHADLFGSFLICGTLIGLALLRKIYGT